MVDIDSANYIARDAKGNKSQQVVLIEVSTICVMEVPWSSGCFRSVM